MELTAADIGSFIDSKAGKLRTAKDVSGRIMEEVTELCLCSGMSAGEILACVADALHNQSLKASSRQQQTVFPSQLTDVIDDLPQEIADVQVFLKDLAYITGTDIHKEEQVKWSAFIKKEFRVSERGTLYAIKPHIVSK